MTTAMAPNLLQNRSSTPRGTAPRRRLLLIAYAFPPVGGAGVQRPVKWVKYLQRADWDVTVLTPSNPSVPVIDQSLEAEIPAETAFIRPPTWEPSYQAKNRLVKEGGATPTWTSWPKRALRSLVRGAATRLLQPDPQILWSWNAIAAATQHLRAVPHDAILATAPPYSSFLIGAKLKQRFGLPLLLDYRDEWDLSSRYLENAQRDRWSQFVQERMQRRVLQAADAVIATTRSSVTRLQERLEHIQGRARTACIYNGFDEADFADERTDSVVPETKPGTLRLVYTGTLWNLTNVAPVVAGLERLQSQRPELLSRIEFVCVGRKTPDQQSWLDRAAKTGCRVVPVDYCDHSTVLDWQRSASSLCLLLSDVPGAERVVPAKLFEYLAARKDVLAVMPAGEATDLIAPFHPEGCFQPGDVAGIANWFESRLQRTTPVIPTDDDQAIKQFSREAQTRALRSLLETVVTGRKGN